MEDWPDGNVDLWSWNINGINAVLNKGDLIAFMKEVNPTVLCLNETKTSIDMIEKKSFATQIVPGYTQYWNCCKIRKGYSGTAIFTKVRPLSVKFDFGSKHVQEGRSITMEFK